MAYDHVVIGSGINGLVCAALLSKRGRKALVLEREAVAGGCMRTDEITVPGFRHDVMAAIFPLFVTSPAYAKLGPDLHRHGLEFLNTPHPTGVLMPDGRALVLTTDRDANRRAFNDAHEGDGDRLREDIAAVEREAGLLFALLGGSLWTWPTARLLFGEARRRGLRGLLARAGEALKTSRDWLETRYRSDLVRALFAPWPLHAGLDPESSFGGEMGRVMAFALEAAGAPLAKGGTGQAAAAFVSLIHEQGGVVRTGADVAEILVENGRATGVRLADGETIAAGSVIASVTPTQLYQRLLPESASRPQDRAQAAAYRYGKGDMQIHYALKRPPAWRTGGLEKVMYLHLTQGLDGVSRAANECIRGLLPAEPTICVCQPTAVDTSRCPEGAAILWVQLPEAPREVKGDAAGEIDVPADGRWSEALREAYADRIEKLLARHIDGFADTILARRAYAPPDLEALNINLVGGEPYGGACTIDQFFLFRPFPDSRNHATAIRNLYHIGASTHPGPGLGGGSGHNLAERLR